MKVIDLLNKIANGEEVPKNIRINGYIYEYQGDDYLFIDKNNDNKEYWLFSDNYTNKFQWLDVFLKTEVKIIEEEKEIEEIKSGQLFTIDDGEINYNFQVCKDKINKLTDELNKIKKEGK